MQTSWCTHFVLCQSHLNMKYLSLIMSLLLLHLAGMTIQNSKFNEPCNKKWKVGGIKFCRVAFLPQCTMCIASLILNGHTGAWCERINRYFLWHEHSL